MRIALVFPRSSEWTPGEPREDERLRLLAERLGARGHNVVVFCTRFWDGSDRSRREAGVTYRAVTYWPAPAEFVLRLPVAIGRFSPAVVHGRPEPPAVALAARLGAVASRCPLVVEWNGDESLDSTWLGRRVLGSADRLLAPSELVATRLVERGAEDDAVERVPWGIDLARLRATEPRDGAAVVTAGPLDARSNLDDLLLALAERREAREDALVIGDGPERAAYEARAADLGIAGRVTFLGACPRSERIARYRDSHTFVQTRAHEPFALELLWALACGCCGVVEYQAESSAHELLTGHPRGVRVTDPDELDDALAEAAGYGHRTVDDSFDRYGYEAVIDRYLALYQGDD